MQDTHQNLIASRYAAIERRTKPEADARPVKVLHQRAQDARSAARLKQYLRIDRGRLA